MHSPADVPSRYTATHGNENGNGNATCPSAGARTERTCVLIKPDGVQRNLIGTTISAFERKGYTLVAMKMLIPCKQQVEYHYREMAAYSFFPSLVKYMLSAPSVVMVWSGNDVIHMGRKVIGPPMPRNAKSGTLRGKYTESIARNALHASAHEKEAQEEAAKKAHDATSTTAPPVAMDIPKANSADQGVQFGGWLQQSKALVQEA